MSSDRPVLIVDGLNLFVRSWAAYPTMSSHGYQMGGCVGFMKTLGRIVSEIQPTIVVVAWEGGGSQRRRKLFPEYKLGRRAEKLNRFYGDDIPDTDENKNHQLMSLLSMLKSAPVCQVYASDCEGDDVVAFLCTGPYRDMPKIIASSDKDMYQLLDDRTRIYSFHKKKCVTSDDIFEEFRVRPHNFALAKALCGDSGDNVPGIKGLGFKTVATKFPFLGGEHSVLLQDLLDFSSSHSGESAIYRRVSESVEEIKRNWQLVHLDGSMLSAAQVTRVQHAIDTFQPRFDRMGLMRSLLREGINDFDVEGFFYAFRCIDGLTV